MKKIMLVGNVGCGKTTLCQVLNGLQQTYRKTQAIEVVNQTIDTPGEYMERHSMMSALIVTSVEADLALFVQEAGQERFMFSPGQSSAFPIPVAGVVSKADQATEEEIDQAAQFLQLAGASPVFVVSAKTGQGIAELSEFLGYA